MKPRRPAKVAAGQPWVCTPKRIVFEDAFLIALNKPAGYPCHATRDRARDHVTAGLQRFLAKRDGTPPRLSLQHRLDRDTSGVLLFAKDATVNEPLNRAFRERQVQKVYLAVTAPQADAPTASQWTVDNFLARDKDNPHRMTAVLSGGDAAQTQFTRLAGDGARVLVEARPKTGRTHQIRVHLAQSGLPIWGDVLYGGPAGERVLLHAWKLQLTHPISGETLVLVAPKPKPFRDSTIG